MTTIKKVSAALGEVEHLPSRVVAHINREIKTGRLKAGEKLPSETELANELGVSRNVVREATSQLRADGVIQARQGVGAFVMSPEDSKVIRLDPRSLSDRHELGQLFELRAVLETEAAALASTKITPAALHRLKDALNLMTGDERTSEGSIEADLAFHREIASASGNDYIETFINYIALQIRQSIHTARRAAPIETVVGPTVEEHIRIYDALAAGDPVQARAAMRAHILGAAERVGAPITNQSDQEG